MLIFLNRREKKRRKKIWVSIHFTPSLKERALRSKSNRYYPNLAHKIIPFVLLGTYSINLHQVPERDFLRHNCCEEVRYKYYLLITTTTMPPSPANSARIYDYKSLLTTIRVHCGYIVTSHLVAAFKCCWTLEVNRNINKCNLKFKMDKENQIIGKSSIRSPQVQGEG